MIKRKALAAWSMSQDGSKAFAYAPYYSAQYPEKSYKCSGFVCAAAKKAGAPTEVNVPDGRGGSVDRCATAAEFGRGNVKDWRFLRPNEKQEPGDIMADPFFTPEPGATGHAAVVVDDGAGGTSTIGAHYGGVGPVGADYPKNPVYRRYTGE